MPLTVRLPDPLEQALDAYCAEHGRTRSEVVQESLAAHLSQAGVREGNGAKPREVSPAYAALARAGLIGAVRLGGRSASKEVVRARLTERLKRQTG